MEYFKKTKIASVFIYRRTVFTIAHKQTLEWELSLQKLSLSHFLVVKEPAHDLDFPFDFSESTGEIVNNTASLDINASSNSCTSQFKNLVSGMRKSEWERIQTP